MRPRLRSRCCVCHKTIQLNRKNAPVPDEDACWECMAFGLGDEESRAQMREWATEELELRAVEADRRRENLLRHILGDKVVEAL